MLKYLLRAVYCLFLGRLWQSQYISAMSKTQGGGLIREQFPPNRYSKESKEKWRKLSRKPVVVWSFLQKLRGFKLICKHYFMYKVTNKLYYNKN